MENPRPAREISHAHVAELVDALVSGTSIGNDVEVRVLSCALSQKSFMLQGPLCERAVVQMGWHLAVDYEATMLLQATETVGKVDALAMPNVFDELLQSSKARTVHIRAAIARLWGMAPAE